MGFRNQCIAVIVFSLLVQTLGELIMIQHPPDDSGTTRNVTCMSDDDNAALVWNHNLVENERDFKPKLPTITLTDNQAKCAIWNSTGCLVNWKKEEKGWDKVNSADTPMGPVFDFRWEGFNEITFADTKNANQSVIKVEQRTGSVVFSVRTLKEVHIFMCKGQNLKKSSCLWIKIEERPGRHSSSILFCKSGIIDNPSNRNCCAINEIMVKPGNYLDLYKWRTFRITWDNDENKKIIKVFRHSESTPFLQSSSIFADWLPKSHIRVEGEPTTRVRFHFYDYWRTEVESVSLSTEIFQTDNIFHVELLYGLCPECKMNVSLVDKEGRYIMDSSRQISGDNKSVSNGILNWQSIELEFSVQDVDRDDLRLEIQTIFHNRNATGHWAIGNFRVKKSVDEVRKSTVTIHNYGPSFESFPVKCQKISYNDPAIVVSRLPSKNDNVKSELQPYIYQLIESCNSVCNHTANWTICNSIKCISMRGFDRSNCDKNGTPRFEIIPGDKNVTVNSCSSMTQIQNYTLKIWENQTIPPMGPIHSTFSSLPYKYSELNPCTEYRVELLDSINKQVIKTQIRTLRSAPLKRRNTSTVPNEMKQRPKIPYLVWLAIPLVIIICLLLFIFCIRRKRSKAQAQETEVPMEEMGCTNVEDPPENYSPIELVNLGSIRKSSPDVIPTHDSHSSPIKVEDFEKYTKDALGSNLLNSQYTTFAPGPAKPCEIGQLAENVTKNRYQDQIPYDDTRVILNDDPNSDYINANYIRGYSKSKAYIATQGPKPKTVKDFWRMIWQEKVSVICMLANVVEGGTKKCEQYWPAIGTRVKNGDILITNTNHQVFADYTFRTLSVRYRKETREVMHLHYTGWPDHGVPMYTQSLVLYLKKLLATSNGAGPIVVHCSAGVGRTGTIILCAICLRKAVAERVIDVPAVLVRMREDRANMVNNAQQYLLAHLAIVESMTVQQTQIPCDDFLPVKIKELKKQLPSDIKRLKDTVWQDRVLHSLAAARKKKQKNVTDGPSETISDDFEIESNCIDAVSVDGARLKRQNLASRLPSSSTISDFWALIAEKRIELVVILQCPDPKDRKSCDIVPSETITNPLPSLQVEIKKEPEKQEHFTTNKLMLTETLKGESRSQPVTVLTYTGYWGQDKKRKQPTAAGLVSLWMASEKIPRKETPTLVLCQNGVTLCGLYLALNFLLERMTVEGECDVISAVRAVRRSKTEFVQSLGQFEHLYEAAVKYHELFKTYANFS